MLGIAVLFFLALWFLIVCFATFLPLKLIENKLVASIFAFIGFMLTFGYWWLDMMIEGNRAYQAGVEACKQAKITIYVQPEKWIEMVGGHNVWMKLANYEEKETSEFSDKEKQTYPITFIFEGIEYHLDYITHKRILVYDSGYYEINNYAKLKSVLYYDWETGTVLYKRTQFPKNYSSGITVSNLLGIRNGHKECNPEDQIKTYKRFFYLK